MELGFLQFGAVVGAGSGGKVAVCLWSARIPAGIWDCHTAPAVPEAFPALLQLFQEAALAQDLLGPSPINVCPENECEKFLLPPPNPPQVQFNPFSTQKELSQSVIGDFLGVLSAFARRIGTNLPFYFVFSSLTSFEHICSFLGR